MLTEQYSKSFAQAGGVGVATEVYRTLITQQANAICATSATLNQSKSAATKLAR